MESPWIWRLSPSRARCGVGNSVMVKVLRRICYGDTIFVNFKKSSLKWKYLWKFHSPSTSTWMCIYIYSVSIDFRITHIKSTKPLIKGIFFGEHICIYIYVYIYTHIYNGMCLTNYIKSWMIYHDTQYPYWGMIINPLRSGMTKGGYPFWWGEDVPSSYRHASRTRVNMPNTQIS